MTGTIETIETRELDFGAITHGEGNRIALCLHGFPDDPGSMRPMMETLSDAGFTAVAPYLRGYGPTETPEIVSENYTIPKLASDILSLLDALEADDPLLIGHDWGAVASTTASTLAPDRIGKCVIMSVPPNIMTAIDDSGTQPLRSWYMSLFQIPGVAEEFLRKNDFALIERLWNLWSPEWDYSERRLQEVKETFRTGETVKASLQIYRSFFEDFLTLRRDELQIRGIEVPTLVLAGEHDGCIGADLYENIDQCYARDPELELIRGAGHFVHAEKPDLVGNLILDFIE